MARAVVRYRDLWTIAMQAGKGIEEFAERYRELVLDDQAKVQAHVDQTFTELTADIEGR